MKTAITAKMFASVVEPDTRLYIVPMLAWEERRYETIFENMVRASDVGEYADKEVKLIRPNIDFGFEGYFLIY